MLTMSQIIRNTQFDEQYGLRRGGACFGVHDPSRLRGANPPMPLPPAEHRPQRKSRALVRFKPGVSVQLGCYKPGCGTVRIPVILGEDETKLLHPTFNGPDGMKWKPGTPVREYRLAKRVHCPQCRTLFASAIIVSNGKSRRPTIFGYDPEPI